MKPGLFPQNNLMLQRPDSMSREECSPLAVFKSDDGMISKWVLSEEEKEQVAETGEVWLWVMSSEHPPVYIGTDNPFE